MDLWERRPEKNRHGTCAVRFCRKRREKRRTICRRCRQRIDVINNPVANAYRNLKHHARERQIPFDLTYAQFEEFCLMTGYLEHRGRTKLSFSVDREDDTRGYSVDNIRVLTLSANSAKAAADRKAFVDERLASARADDPF